MKSSSRPSEKFFGREREGELYLVSSTIFWALFPVITILTFSELSALVTAGVSTLIAAVVFGILLTVRNKWHELLVREAWRDIALTTVIIGIVFYGLVFTGASYTSANNMSIILLLEIFFNQLILGLWGKERLSYGQRIGSLFMVVGALLVLFPGEFKLNRGDLILVIACMVPPFGNFFMQQARKKVSSITILFARSTAGGAFLLLLALCIEGIPGRDSLLGSSTFLLINGILLLGLSKILWIEAIHRITISKATALSAGTPLITMVFSYFLLSETPTAWQLIGFIPIALGIFLLTRQVKLQ